MGMRHDLAERAVAVVSPRTERWRIGLISKKSSTISFQ